MRKLWLLLLVWLALVALRVTAAPPVVSICGEAGDGPPWLYWQKSSQEGGPPKLAGFTVDMLSALFSRLGTEANIQGDMPWKRCLKEVAEGKIDFASGAYFDEERAKLFAYSQPYKTLTPQVFYRSEHPLPIKSTLDLKHYHGCGMNGSSYAHYGLRDADLDLGARSYAALIKKLKAGYCDYFVEELEVIAQLDGGRQHYLDDPELAHAPIAGATAPALHLVTSIHSPKTVLIPSLNTALSDMIKSGEFARLWKKNAGNVPF